MKDVSSRLIFAVQVAVALSQPPGGQLDAALNALAAVLAPMTVTAVSRW